MSNDSNYSGRIRSLVVALLALQLLLVGARAVTTVRAQDQLPAAPETSAFTFDTPAMALTIPTGVDRGNQVAARWNDQAKLVFASMQVDWSTDAPPATITALSPFGWIRLLYVAPISNGPSEYAALSVMFERVSGRLVAADASRWDLTPPEAGLLDGVTVSDETAVLAVEISRGTAYRAACPNLRSQSLIAIERDPLSGAPIWSVSYRENGRDASGAMRIDVNASDGTVNEIRPGPDSCAKKG
jgi:hypothetical protein